MLKRRRFTALPGILFGVLVFLLALTNSFLPLYPFGAAVLIRPALGLLGILGALCLFAASRWWIPLLSLWSLLQTCIIATDVSREWFYQGVMCGWQNTSTVRMNELLTIYTDHGVNFAGPILFLMILAIAAFHLYPAHRPLPFLKPFPRLNRRIIAAVALVAVIAVSTLFAWRRVQNNAATFVLDLDLPRVPIYYKDQLLGHTPLRFTPETIRDWKLPINASRPLKLFGWGWADCVVLSDGANALPLYAAAPWPFAHDLDIFDSPWGPRSRMHVGGENANQRTGYLYPRADLRHEPILTITLLDPQPLPVGTPLRLHCILTNPTAKDYAGRKATITRHTFSYDHRNLSATLPATLRYEVTMSPLWNQLPPGATLASDIEFDAPSTPGDYELFCNWFLYTPDENSETGVGGCYSNMLRLQIK